MKAWWRGECGDLAVNPPFSTVEQRTIRWQPVIIGAGPCGLFAVFELGLPVLGICYGMQTMAVQLGGKVEWSDHREFGYAEARAHGHSKLLEGIQDFATPEGHGMLKVWMSHGDKVTELPAGFKVIDRKSHV